MKLKASVIYLFSSLLVFMSTTSTWSFDHDYTQLIKPNETVMLDVVFSAKFDENGRPTGEWANVAYVAIKEGFMLSKFYDANKRLIADEYPTPEAFYAAACELRQPHARGMDCHDYFKDLHTDHVVYMPLTKWYPPEVFDITRDEKSGKIIRATLCDDTETQNIAIHNVNNVNDSDDRASMLDVSKPVTPQIAHLGVEELESLNALNTVDSGPSKASVFPQTDMVIFNKYRPNDYLVGILSVMSLMSLFFLGLGSVISKARSKV